MDDRELLIIEDDPDISDLLDLTLRDEGYRIERVFDGEHGLAMLHQKHFDLVVLDLMLPGIDGLEVCRQLRAKPRYIPIIIISARSTETHRIIGLELGADDYLTKPFSTLELGARVRALFRRIDAVKNSNPDTSGRLQEGGLSIDPWSREVSINGAPVTLTSREFDLLYFFARHPGRVFSRIQLLDSVWGYSHDGYEHTVNSHINRLRSKIELDPGLPEYILTVWGVGYKFNDRVCGGKG